MLFIVVMQRPICQALSVSIQPMQMQKCRFQTQAASSKGVVGSSCRENWRQ